MKLYHYTSIETLALILKHKTIRFSRLDRVDDPDEYAFSGDGVTPAHYCFVSCWTKNSRENLPQWYMYGNSTHGVRIELDSDMFELQENRVCPNFLNKKFFEDNGIVVMPIQNDGFLKEIQYVDNAQDMKTQIFKDLGFKRGIDFKKIGIYKSMDWAFQQECRFILCAFPLMPNGLVNPSYVLQNNISPKLSYIDVPIKEECLRAIKIMLGPKMFEAEKTIVESLMQTYLQRNDYICSSYTGKL